MNHHFHLCTTENIVLWHGLEANTALHHATYVSLSTTPLCYISCIALTVLILRSTYKLLHCQQFI